MESNVQLAKYDKVRKQRLQRVFFACNDQKLERSAFNVDRTKLYSATELQFFEKCKEERLTKDKGGDSFEALIEQNSPLTCELLSNKQFFLGFMGYIVACQLRLIVEMAVRNRSEGRLIPIETALQLAELEQTANNLYQKIEKRQRMLLKCGKDVGID